MTTNEVRKQHKEETGNYPGQIRSIVPVQIEHANRMGLLNYIYWLEGKLIELNKEEYHEPRKSTYRI